MMICMIDKRKKWKKNYNYNIMLQNSCIRMYYLMIMKIQMILKMMNKYEDEEQEHDELLLLEQDETLDFEVDLELHTDVLQDKLLEISQHVDDELEHFLLQLQLDDEEELDNEVQEDIFLLQETELDDTEDEDKDEDEENELELLFDKDDEQERDEEDDMQEQLLTIEEDEILEFLDEEEKRDDEELKLLEDEVEIE